MLAGFLLGISSGTVCLAYCAPVLLPYFMGEAKNIRGNSIDLLLFLGGRLAGYLLFAILAWKINQLVFLRNSANHNLLLGLIYFIIAGLLIVFAFQKKKTTCMAEPLRKHLSKLSLPTLPAVLGFLTGVNLCPPFLMAFTNATQSKELLQSLLFFGAFFGGTIIYFIPFPFIGMLNRYPGVQIVGKFASAIIGSYYLYLGLILVLGGLSA